MLLGSLIIVTDPFLLGLWSVLIGAGAGFVTGLPTAIIADLVAPPQHGIAIGWLRTVTDSGMLLGPVVIGMLADAVHLGISPFLCVCAAHVRAGPGGVAGRWSRWRPNRAGEHGSPRPHAALGGPRRRILLATAHPDDADIHGRRDTFPMG